MGLKKRLGKSLVGLCWVLEVMKNGTPHYHVICVLEKDGCRVPYPDKSKLWRYGMSNVKWKVRSVFYIASYLKKQYQKDFEKYPFGGRLFSIYFRDKDLKERFKFEKLTDAHKGIVSRFGWDVYQEEVKSWKSSSGWEHVGSTMTEDYAQMLADGYRVEKSKTDVSTPPLVESVS